MKHTKILFTLCAAMLVAGCNIKPSDEPLWEDEDVVETSTLPTYDTVESKWNFSLMNYEEKQGLYLDVDFDGEYELLEDSNFAERDCYTNPKYEVYKIVDGEKVLMDDEPYNKFRSRTASWVMNSGVEINYSSKTIVLHSLEEGSCSDFGATLVDTYKYDTTTGKFTHKQKRNAYDFGE